MKELCEELEQQIYEKLETVNDYDFEALMELCKMIEVVREIKKEN